MESETLASCVLQFTHLVGRSRNGLPSTIDLKYILQSRVPKLCPRHAFLPFLFRLTHRKINNLPTISMG
jgi:hypothetical protein